MEDVYDQRDVLHAINKNKAVSRKSECAGSLTIVSDHEELLRRFCHYRDALDYCLATLKHHHMTKRGISTLVANTEEIKNRANAKVQPEKTRERL